MSTNYASARQRQRLDGTIAWQALYRQDGRQSSRTFETMEQRDRFISMVRQIGLDGALEVLEANHTGMSFTTLGEYARADIEKRTGITEGHRARIAREVERDWGKLAQLPIEAINTTHIRSWVRDMERAGLSGKTIRNKHGLMSSVFRSAVTDPNSGVKRNPCEGTKLPRIDDGEERMHALTHGQFAVLLSCVPEHYRPFLTALAATGMRWGEATALSVAHLDQERGELRVVRAWKKAPTGWEIGATKTKRGRRSIPLGSSVLREISTLAEGAEPDDLLFRNTRGGRIRYATFYEQVWTPALRLANGLHGWPDKGKSHSPSARSIWHGIKPVQDSLRLGFYPGIHDLRHTAASWMIEATGDIYAVQHMLGHESIQTTVDLYGDLMPGRKERVAAAMDLAMGQALPELEA